MNSIALVAAGLAGLLHIGFFYLESIAFLQPTTYRRFRIGTEAEAKIIRPWAFNQGWYNLFLAAGALAGVVVWLAGHHDPARALIALACGSMLGAALVLVAGDRRMAGPAAVQGLFPLLALALIW